MSVITASLVKDLREKTGAGMMDCKKALNEVKGDFEAAVDWLRKKGLAAAAKKAGRVAAEGLVAIATDGSRGTVLEVNAETDFVARNEQFQQFVRSVADVALANNCSDIDALKGITLPSSGKSVEETLTGLIATIGENMALRRVQTISVQQGVVSGYMHGALTPGLGKIGVLVALQSSGNQEVLQETGKSIAMHVAAATPLFLTTNDVDSDAVERERNIFAEQARASGKPDNIIEKMVEGRIRKYYEEVVLTEQTFVIDGENKIGKVVENAATSAGAPVQLTQFVRYALGEGIEKESDDFAEEVKKMAG